MADVEPMIIGAVTVTALTTFVAQATRGTITFKPYLGALFVGMFLTFIAMLNTQLARNFAALVILVAILKNGNDTFSYVRKATK